jgi:hypothetical protein
MNRFLFVLVASAFVVLVAVSVVLAVSAFNSKDESTVVVAEDEIPTADQVASESQGGPQEGIKVHGEWTIEVFDPDGKLAAHREFKNALLTSGADHLVKVLGRQNAIGAWRVSFGELSTNATGTFIGTLGPCLLSNSSPIQCNLEEFNAYETNSFVTLKMSVPKASTDVGKLQLKGPCYHPKKWQDRMGFYKFWELPFFYPEL